MKTLSRWMPVIGGAVAGGIIAVLVASGSSTSRSVTTTVTTQVRQAALPASLSKSSGQSVNQIYKSASPGVVDILVISQSPNPTAQLLGGGGTQKSLGEGAGVVYNREGYILTDQHVVSRAISVKVNFQDGKSYPAKVIGTDPSTDIGVIKVSAPSSELHPIAFADSSQAAVGDPVVAIGSPFSLPETTTTGIVSQTGRPITAPNRFTITNAIQTDAAINPGNSGGPLLDAAGHVLGLNDQIETNNTTVSGQGSSSGVGFAIPSNTVRRIAAKLIAVGSVKHAYVGVCLSSASVGGASISELGGQGGCPGSSDNPASRAGLKLGDLVTAMNGKTVISTEAFIAMVDNYAPGQTVTMTVRRGGQTKQITVRLGTRSQTPTGG